MNPSDLHDQIRGPLRGRRAAVDEHGVSEMLADDAPVQFWVCQRVDEPWTWRLMTQQYFGVCTRCGSGIVYRVSATSPDPMTPKVCARCFARLIADSEDR